MNRSDDAIPVARGDPGITDEDSVAGILEALRARGAVRIRVWGSSMFPFVWPGSTVTVEAAHRAELRRGDLVLLRHGGTVALHRLVDPASGTTQADWFEAPDAPGEIVGRARTNVLGRWHVSPVFDRIAAAIAQTGAPVIRRVRDRARPQLRWAWRTVSRNETIASIRRRIWPYRVELLRPDRLPLVKPYLLRRGLRPGRATLEAWQRSAHGAPARFVAIAVARGAIVGSLIAVERTDPGHWELVDIWVSRQMRGLGLATSLVRTGTEEATRRGATQLHAHVRRERGAAWRAFNAAGFAEVGAAPHVSPFHVRMQLVAS